MQDSSSPEGADSTLDLWLGSGEGVPLPVPARLGHYEVVRQLGMGGMSRVFLARDTRLGRDVAIKLLLELHAGNAQRLALLRQEARLASALNHPHICTIHELGESQGLAYIVMEVVEGCTLREFIRSGADVESAVQLGVQVARALASAHEVGVVHLDIKPENVMVRDDGYVKVVDFGLARPLFASAPGLGSAPTVNELRRLVGTITYMSPEQSHCEELGSESDIFSLGIVLYELATGRHPFAAPSQMGTLQAIGAQSPVSPERLHPEIQPALSALILRMLEKERHARPTAAEVTAALERLATGGEVASRRAGDGGARRHAVGRAQETAALRDALAQATAGRGQLLCVSGEPGIGKSTLVEAFLSDLEASNPDVAVARGRCSERLAGTEAYLPFLEAMESLLRRESGPTLARTMKAVAPSWFVQVAPLVAGEEVALAEAQGMTREKLKRELVAFLTESSRARPLVIFFDDLHWADSSTIDLLGYVVDRCRDLRVLLMASYRPSDLLLAGHPFVALKLDLQARGACHEIALEFLTREAIEQYIAQEFPGHGFPDDLADLVHARTEGSPLFMTDLLRYLRDRGVLTEEGGRWMLGSRVPDLARELPQSVRSMIQRKIDQLEEPDRRLLLAGCVQGYEFDAAVVATTLQLDPADVEERLEVLERMHLFVARVREHELPDRTLTLRYSFVHVLYQNALYASLQPTRRVKLHGEVAAAMEHHHRGHTEVVATELALLHEGARRYEEAVGYSLTAARRAVRVCANREAVKLVRLGLAMLEKARAGPDRDRLELALLLTLGPPLKDSVGWATPELVRVSERARELAESVGEISDRFAAVWGLWIAHSSANDLELGEELGKELVALAEEQGDSGLMVQANHALTTTYACAGQWTVALTHSDAGFERYDRHEHCEHKFVYGGHDPGVCCLGFGALSLWMLGQPDLAKERLDHSRRLAAELDHPTTLAIALTNGAFLGTLRRDLAAVEEHSRSAQTLVEKHGLPFFGGVTLGWAMAQRGEARAGADLIRASIPTAAHRAPTFWLFYFHLLLADACRLAGDLEGSRRALAESARRIAGTGTGFCVPELHRLRADLLLALPARDEAGAESELHRALDIARQQGARSLELRALTSLADLYQAQGRLAEVLPRLAACHAAFTEGLDSQDLRRASELLR